ncbi:uncharacterized protein LOC135821344 isoform X2 [Sycon ciliatum]|uniref:uncharacterized protein LOC135821344 isoform X2 n=1 Tax=Sycon ciliatum TaxID=27933 RepID=UPI0031F67960
MEGLSCRGRLLTAVHITMVIMASLHDVTAGRDRRHQDNDDHQNVQPSTPLPFLCVKAQENGQFIRSRDCCPSPGAIIIPVKPTTQLGPIEYRDISASQLCQESLLGSSSPDMPSRRMPARNDSTAMPPLTREDEEEDPPQPVHLAKGGRPQDCNLDGEKGMFHTFHRRRYRLPSTCVHTLARDCFQTPPRYQLIGEMVPCTQNRSNGCFKKIDILLMSGPAALSSPLQSPPVANFEVVQLWMEPGDITVLKIGSSTTRHRRGSAKRFLPIPGNYGVVAAFRRTVRVYLDWLNITIAVRFPHSVSVKQSNASDTVQAAAAGDLHTCGLCMMGAGRRIPEPLLCYSTCSAKGLPSADMRRADEFCRQRLGNISAGCLASSESLAVLHQCQNTSCAMFFDGAEPDSTASIHHVELCRVMKDFGRVCTLHGHTVDWSLYESCGVRCQNNMEVDICARPRTCSQLSATTTSSAGNTQLDSSSTDDQCTIGCRCRSDNRVLHNGRCILKTRCPCVDSEDGREYAAWAAKRVNATHWCQCVQGTEFQCHKLAEARWRIEVNGSSIGDRNNRVLVPQGQHCVKMTCRLRRGFPRPRLHWRKVAAGGKVSVSSTFRSATLTIPVMTRRYQSAYECHAQGSQRSAESVALLMTDVPVGTLEVQPISHITTVVGSKAELVCNVHGNPPPHVTWLKDGRPLYSLDGERVSVHQQCENRLQFTSLRSSDAGVYACLVENKLRSKQVNATLTVTGRRRRRSTSDDSVMPVLCVRGDLSGLRRSRDCCPSPDRPNEVIIPILPSSTGALVYRSNITADELCRRSLAPSSPSLPAPSLENKTVPREIRPAPREDRPAPQEDRAAPREDRPVTREDRPVPSSSKSRETVALDGTQEVDQQPAPTRRENAFGEDDSSNMVTNIQTSMQRGARRNANSMGSSSQQRRSSADCRLDSSSSMLTTYSGSTFAMPRTCIHLLAGDCRSQASPQYQLFGDMVPCHNRKAHACFKQINLHLYPPGGIILVQLKNEPNNVTIISLPGQDNTLVRIRHQRGEGRKAPILLPLDYGTIVLNKKTIRINLVQLNINIRITFPSTLIVKLTRQRAIPPDSVLAMATNKCGLCGWGFPEQPTPLVCYPACTADVLQAGNASLRENEFCGERLRAISPTCMDAEATAIAAAVVQRQCAVGACKAFYDGFNTLDYQHQPESEVCKAMSGYTKECLSAGHQVNLSAIQDCLQCGQDQAADHCSQQRTCLDHLRQASGIVGEQQQRERAPCELGCRCLNARHVLYKGRCIQPAECPCMNLTSGRVILEHQQAYLVSRTRGCQCQRGSKIVCRARQGYRVHGDLVQKSRGRRREIYLPYGELCVELVCRLVSGFPRPRLGWRKWTSGGQHTLSQRSDGLYLTIPALTREYRSRYDCQIPQIRYARSDGFYVKPKSSENAPLEVRLMADVRREIGEAAVLECRASGNPIPTVVWFKNGARYVPDGVRVQLHRTCTNRLLFHKLRVEDQGNYSCHITSGVLSEVVRAQLIVDDRWNDWSTWSECSTSCGPGVRLRRRTCNMTEPDSTYCPGSNTDTESCDRACWGNCNTLGSLWYRSFDGFEYTFQSKCAYTLSQHCSNVPGHVPLYTIVQYTGGATEEKLSYDHTVGIKVILSTGDTITVSKNETAQFGNSSVLTLLSTFEPNVPIHHGRLTLSMDEVGAVNITGYAHTDHFVEVIYNMYLQNVDIEVGPEFFNQTCGLCGSWNERFYDDTHPQPWSQRRLRTDQFVRAYRERDQCRSELFSDACGYNASRMADARAMCASISESGEMTGPFAVCNDTLASFKGLMAMCLKEACLCLEDESRSRAWCECKALRRAASECEKHGKSPVYCTTQSCSNRFSHANVSQCVPTCCSQTYTCDRQRAICSDGENCECEYDESFHQGQCIPTIDCPCRHGDSTYHRGESVSLDCRNCECQGKGQWKCDTLNCPERPRITMAPVQPMTVLSPVQLCCRASPNAVSYEWYRNEEGASSRVRIQLLGETSRSLYVPLSFPHQIIPFQVTYYYCLAKLSDDKTVESKAVSRVQNVHGTREEFDYWRSHARSNRTTPDRCGGWPLDRKIALPTGCRLLSEDGEEGSDDAAFQFGDQQLDLLTSASNRQVTINVGQCSLKRCASDYRYERDGASTTPDHCAYSGGGCCTPSLVSYRTLICMTGAARQPMQMRIPVVDACRCATCYRHKTFVNGVIGSGRQAGLRFTVGVKKRRMSVHHSQFRIDLSEEDSDTVAFHLDTATRPPYSIALPVHAGKAVFHQLDLPTFVRLNDTNGVDVSVSPSSSSSSSGTQSDRLTAISTIVLAPSGPKANITYSVTDFSDQDPEQASGSFTFLADDGTLTFAQPFVSLAIRVGNLSQYSGLDVRYLRWTSNITTLASHDLTAGDVQLWSVGQTGQWTRPGRLATLSKSDSGSGAVIATASVPVEDGIYAIGYSAERCFLKVHVRQSASGTPVPLPGATVTASSAGLWKSRTQAVTDAWGIACVPVQCHADATLSVHHVSDVDGNVQQQRAYACDTAGNASSTSPAESSSLGASSACLHAEQLEFLASASRYQHMSEMCDGRAPQVSFVMDQGARTLSPTLDQFDAWEGIAHNNSFHYRHSSDHCFMAVKLSTSQSVLTSYLLRAVSLGKVLSKSSSSRRRQQQDARPSIPEYSLYGWREKTVEASSELRQLGRSCIEVACPTWNQPLREVRVLMQVERPPTVQSGRDVSCQLDGPGIQPTLRDDEFHYRDDGGRQDDQQQQQRQPQYGKGVVLRVEGHATNRPEYGVFRNRNQLLAKESCLKAGYTALQLQCN